MSEEINKEYSVIQECLQKAVNNNVFNKVEIFAINECLKQISSMLNQLNELKNGEKENGKESGPEDEVRTEQGRSSTKG